VATRKTAKPQTKRLAATGLNGRPKEPFAVPDADLAARSDSPSFEQIRLRAYEIFEARGGRDGNELSDWLEAEKQLLKGPGSRSA